MTTKVEIIPEPEASASVIDGRTGHEIVGSIDVIRIDHEDGAPRPQLGQRCIHHVLPAFTVEVGVMTVWF